LDDSVPPLLWGTIAQLALHDLARQQIVEARRAAGDRAGLGAMTKPLVLLTVGATVVILLVFRVIRAIWPEDGDAAESSLAPSRTFAYRWHRFWLDYCLLQSRRSLALSGSSARA